MRRSHRRGLVRKRGRKERVASVVQSDGVEGCGIDVGALIAFELCLALWRDGELIAVAPTEFDFNGVKVVGDSVEVDDGNESRARFCAYRRRIVPVDLG